MLEACHGRRGFCGDPRNPSFPCAETFGPVKMFVEKMSRSKFHRWSWLIPVLLALAFNLNVLQNGFGWDDETIIPHLKPPDRWIDLFLPTQPPHHSPISAYLHFRPLTTVSYLLDHKLWGDRPLGFHLSVYLAHLLNTALVFFGARSLIRLPQTPRRGFLPDPSPLTPHGLLPLVAASLFAVHPVHAEAVAWIAGRNDVFCTTFLLTSLLLYLHFHRTGRRRFFALSMLAFFFALLTKEIAVGLIFLFPLFEFLAMEKDHPVPWIRLALRFAVPLAILAIYFWMRSATLQFLPGGSSSPVTLSLPILLEIVRAYGFYFDRMLFPYPHNPFIATLPASNFLLFSSALIFVLLMTALLLAVVHRRALFGIGLAWTIIFIAPAAAVTAFHLAATAAAERYVYAPSAGFYIVGAGLLLKGAEKLSLASSIKPNGIKTSQGVLLVIIFSVGIVGLWGWQSWTRNAVWRSPVAFWEAAVAASPEAGLPHRLLAIQYASMDRYSEAEGQYLKAVETFQKTLGPGHLAVADSLYDLANLYHDWQKYSEAEPLYRQAIAIWKQVLGPDHPDVANGLHNLALAYEAQGQYAEAEPFYRQALEVSEKALKPDDPKLGILLQNYARLLRSMRRDEDARELEARAREIFSHHIPD
jgi:tetratricopeptide (TPR) repeat protein